MKTNQKPFEYLKWSATFLKLGYYLTTLPQDALGVTYSGRWHTVAEGG